MVQALNRPIPSTARAWPIRRSQSPAAIWSFGREERRWERLWKFS